MGSTINKIIKVFIILLAIFVSSACSTVYINKKDFSNYPPKNIGIVAGYDISVKATLSTGEEILLGITGGLTGLIVSEALSGLEYRLEFEQQINDMVFERIHRQMLEKGYNVSLLRTKVKEWDLFENMSNKEEVFPKMLKTYELETDTLPFDAILFFEYWLRGRLPGRVLKHTNLETLNVENMQLKYAKSKIFLYDTKSGKRLYFDCIQRGYSSASTKTVSDALDTIVNLKRIPKY